MKLNPQTNLLISQHKIGEWTYSLSSPLFSLPLFPINLTKAGRMNTIITHISWKPTCTAVHCVFLYIYFFHFSLAFIHIYIYIIYIIFVLHYTALFFLYLLSCVYLEMKQIIGFEMKLCFFRIHCNHTVVNNQLHLYRIIKCGKGFLSGILRNDFCSFLRLPQ